MFVLFVYFVSWFLASSVFDDAAGFGWNGNGMFVHSERSMCAAVAGDGDTVHYL